MNSVNIIGTITKDIELRYLPSGVAAAKFSIAVNQDYKKQDGTKVEKTSFFDVEVIGKQSETVNQFFHKASRIGVNGELEQQTWTAQDGTNRSKVVIKLKSFTFIDRKSDNQQQSYQPTVNGMQVDNQTNQRIPEIDIDDELIPF